MGRRRRGIVTGRVAGLVLPILRGGFVFWVQINKPSFRKVLLGIEKSVKTFSIFDKLFPKLVYYCVPLGHTLVKSFFKKGLIIYYHL